MLHITNGDAAAEVMLRAGLAGDIFSWHDVLHEGPVPSGLTLQALSEVRAKFLADCGWGAYRDILRRFEQRDAELAGCTRHEEVVLWFEHDLCDQLQLLQLLDWFSQHDLARTALTLINVSDYLGSMSPETLLSLLDTRKRISEAQLGLAREAWLAFRAPQPESFEAMTARDLSALAFLKAAVFRQLEEYPSTQNGLSRTERAILEAVQAGVTSPPQIFRAVQEREEAVYLSDWPFWRYMNRLITGGPPLLKVAGGGSFVFPPPEVPGKLFIEQDIVLSDSGLRVLEGELDWVASNGIDKWIGGVHLRPARVWRWDPGARRLQRTGR